MRLKLTALLVAFMALSFAMPVTAFAQTQQTGRFQRIGAGMDRGLNRFSNSTRTFGQNVRSGISTTGRFLGRAAMAPFRLGARGVARIQQSRANSALNRAVTLDSGAAAIRQDAREQIHAAREMRAEGRANVTAGNERISAARAGSSVFSRLNPFSSRGRAARAEIRAGRQQIREGNAQLRSATQLGRQGVATRQVAQRAQQRANTRFDRAVRLEASAARLRAFGNGN